jgi:RimJ/RimL family protein N-acetyltransferase
MSASEKRKQRAHQYEPGNTPVALYDDDVLVGFAMYTHEPWQGEFGIVRMMIDKEHHGKGYGRQAVLANYEEDEQVYWARLTLPVS